MITDIRTYVLMHMYVCIYVHAQNLYMSQCNRRLYRRTDSHTDGETIPRNHIHMNVCMYVCNACTQSTVAEACTYIEPASQPASQPAKQTDLCVGFSIHRAVLLVWFTEQLSPQRRVSQVRVIGIIVEELHIDQFLNIDIHRECENSLSRY